MILTGAEIAHLCSGDPELSKAIALEAEKYGAEKSKISVVYSGLDLEIKPLPQTTQNSFFQIVSIGIRANLFTHLYIYGNY